MTDGAICVAVIGPRWINQQNLSRLHDAGDMVRHELVTALATPDLLVVPTLVEGAELPLAVHLPPPLWPLIETWNGPERHGGRLGGRHPSTHRKNVGGDGDL